MRDLAIIVGGMLLTLLSTGPLAVWLAVNKYDLAGLFVAAVALMAGIHWFINISTPIRFIGLGSVLLGVWAIWYIVRLERGL